MLCHDCLSFSLSPSCQWKEIGNKDSSELPPAFQSHTWAAFLTGRREESVRCWPGIFEIELCCQASWQLLSFLIHCPFRRAAVGTGVGKGQKHLFSGKRTKFKDLSILGMFLSVGSLLVLGPWVSFIGQMVIWLLCVAKDNERKG